MKDGQGEEFKASKEFWAEPKAWCWCNNWWYLQGMGYNAGHREHLNYLGIRGH